MSSVYKTYSLRPRRNVSHWKHYNYQVIFHIQGATKNLKKTAVAQKWQRFTI